MMAVPWCRDATWGWILRWGKGSGSGDCGWKAFVAPRPLDIHHMVTKAVGDWPIGLAITHCSS